MDSPMSTDSDFDIDEDPNETVLGLIKSNVPLVEIETALTQPNVQIDFQNASNGSFLYEAILKKRVDIVQLLIDKGADVIIKIRKIKNNSSLKLVDKLLKIEPNNDDLQSIKKLLEDAQPGTSSMGSKSPKRKADQSNTQNQLSGLVDGSASIPPKRPRIDNECNVSGLKLTFHGVVFQVKLLMLFIHRAIRNGYEFRLATEMDIAEKFDDAVLEYSKPNKPKNFILVQAKHKIDCEKSKITITDLKSENDKNAFSLQKYFISFCKIKRNAHFQGAESSKYLIVTNTDFDFIGNETLKSNELIDEWRQYIKLEGKLCDDKILYFDRDDFKAKVHKLCDNNGGLKKMMKQNLLNSALKTKKLKEFKSISAYFHLLLKLGFLRDFDKLNNKFKDLKQKKEQNKQNGKKIILTKDELEKMANDAMKLHKMVFTEKVTQNDIEKKAKETIELLNEKEANKLKNNEFERKLLERYKDKFVGESDNNRIIDIVLMETGVLLESVKDELDRMGNESQQMKNSNENDGLKGEEKEFEEYVNELKMKDQSDLDSDQAETLLGNAREASLIEEALDNAKFEENFNDFIKYFRIVTNYPDESKLGELIKEELGDKFNLLDADLAYAEFERKAFNFLKIYKDGRAPFHNQDEALKDFENIMKKIAKLMISGFGRSYPQKLRQYGLKFKETKKELDNFLKSKSATKIFQLITQSTRLGAIKVLQSVDAIDEYKKSDSLIFMRLRTLLRDETRQQILNSFQSNKSTNSDGSGKPKVVKKTYDLIVIEIQNKDHEKVEDSQNQYCDFIIFLNDLLKSNKMKVIVIDSTDRKSIQKKFNSQTKIEEIKFEDFDLISQRNILGKKVHFQGNNVQLSRLIDETAAEDVLDYLVLSTIIENGKISIGNQSAFSSVGYVEDCYVKRKLCRPINKKILEKKPAAMKLFITGADKEVLTKFGATPDDIVEYQNGQHHDKGIIIPPSDKPDQKHSLFNNEFWEFTKCLIENFINGLFADQEYNEIFRCLGDDVHHWLHYSRSRLLWMDSKNDPLKLLPFIEDDEWLDCDKEDATSNIAIWDEMHFAEINSTLPRTIVIANNAGMGKSTVLTSLARKMRQLDFDNKESTNYRWIVRINLNDFANKAHESCLENIQFDQDNTKRTAEAIDFVTKMTIPGDPEKDLIVRLQQQIFKLSLKKSSMEKKTPQIVLMFDGFDEITPFYKVKTTTLIRALQASQVAQIWISTRVHERLHLQSELNSLGYVVAPLSYKEQNKFINKLWKWQLKFKTKLNGEICERESQEMLSSLNGINLPDRKYAIQLNKYILEIVEDFSPKNHQIELEEVRDAINRLDFSEFFKGIDQCENSINDVENKITDLKINISNQIVDVENCKLPTKFSSQDILNILKSIQLSTRKYAQINECISEIAKVFVEKASQIKLEELRKAIDELDFSEFYKGMIDHWKESIKDDGNRFVINPLQLKMLCEIVFDNNFQLPKDFGLMNLYEKFIEMKFKISNTEKGNFEEGNQYDDGSAEMLKEPLYKIHEALAVDLFFPEYRNALRNLDELEKFQSNEQKKLDFVRRGILVLNDGRLKFIHQSFAEYFLSKYLIKNAEDPRVHDLLFPKILIDRNYSLVRDFFNKQLENTGICIELSETSMKSICNHMMSDDGIFSRYFLVHNYEIFKFVFKAIQKNDEVLREFMTKTSCVDFNFNIFQFVIGCGNNEILEQLLQASLQLEPEKIKKFVLRFNPPVNVCLLASILDGGRNVGMVKTILEFVKKNEEYLGGDCLMECITQRFCVVREIEKNKLLTKSIKDIFGVDYALKFINLNKKFLDKRIVTAMECISENQEVFANFVLKYNQYGQTKLLEGTELYWTQKLVKEFVAILCEQHDTNILENLAIASIYNYIPYRSTETMLKMFNSNSAMYEKLEWVRDNIKRIENKRAGLYTALEENDISKINQIFEKGTAYEVKIFLTWDALGKSLLNKAIERNQTETVNSLLVSKRNSKYEKCLLMVNFDSETPLHQAVELCRNQIVLKLMEFMKEHVGVNSLKKELLKIKSFIHEAAAFKSDDNTCYEYIFQWIKENLGEITLNEMIEKAKKLIDPAALAAETNYFGRTNLANLENITNQNVMEDLAILTVYGDARTNPCENIDKLVPLVENDEKLLELKSRLNNVQQQKHGLDDAIRKGDKNGVIEILNRNEDVIKELVLINNENGQTALHVSAEHNKTEIIHELLKRVMKYPRILEEMVVKINPFNGETVLHVAARHARQDRAYEQSVFILLDFLRDHQDVRTQLLLKPRTEDGLSVISDSEINQCILMWMEDKLDEDTFKDLIEEANSFQWIDLSNATTMHTIISNNIQKLKNLMKYPHILAMVVMQVDSKNCSILLNAAEFYDEHLVEFEINEFLQIIKNINHSETLQNLAILSVFGEARTEPKIIVDKILNVDNITNEMPELCNTLATIGGFIEQNALNDLNNSIVIRNIEQVKNILNQSEKVLQNALLVMHNKKGQTALYVAAEKNESEIVKILLEKAINYPQILENMLFKSDRFLENTALQRAAQLGHHETVSTFLNFFKNPEQNMVIPNFLKTHKNHLIESLRVALDRKHHQTVRIILEFADEHLPDVIQDQIQDIDGICNILEWAEESGDIAEKLIEGIEGTRDGLKCLLFHEANKIKTNDATSILYLLNKKEHDPYLKEVLLCENKGKTFIDISAKANNFKALDWIKEHFNDDRVFLRHFMESIRSYKTSTNIIFLDWVQNNYKEFLMEVLLKRFEHDSYHLNVLNAAVFAEDFEAAKGLLKWIQERCDEKSAFEDLLLSCQKLKLTGMFKDYSFHLKNYKLLLPYLERNSKVLKNVLLSDDNVIYRSFEGFMPRLKQFKHYEEEDFSDVFNLLRSIYDEYARSLLQTDSEMYKFSNKGLEILKKYVNDIYDQPDKGAIQKKLMEFLSIYKDWSALWIKQPDEMW